MATEPYQRTVVGCVDVVIWWCIVDDVMVGMQVAVYVVVSGGGEKVYHRFYTMPVCLPASDRSCLPVCLPACLPV